MRDDDEAQGKDQKTGRFLAGNRFWEARSSHGRSPIFASPDDMWAAALEYFEWVEDNPLKKDQLVTFQGSAKHEPLEVMRAMTIDGLCLFLDISTQTWYDYKSRPDFVEVTTRAEQVIRSQKFAGAAADLLNANIIARDLGLSDKNEITSPDGSMTPKATVDASKMSTEALKELMGAMIDEAPDTKRG